MFRFRRDWRWSFLYVWLVLVNCGLAADKPATTLEQHLLNESAAALATAAIAEGDAVRGAVVFHHSSLTCIACHSLGDRPNAIGPDLTKLDPKTTDGSLVESILEPSKVIPAAYAPISVETKDGLIIRGVPVQETPEKLIIRDAAQPLKLIEIPVQDIVEREPSKVSTMPAGQVNLLSDRRQFLDLVRYLIAVRDGGAKRARELDRSIESLVREFPDRPLPLRPVVQRGEVVVHGGKRYPRGVALGFAGGSLLFDADQLAIVAQWKDGFLKSAPGNYFGVFMHSQGTVPQQFTVEPHPLKFKLAGHDQWQAFETPLQSDPNTGTRFDGYQMGQGWVRLHYRVRVGSQRLQVMEDITVEQQSDRQGTSRILTVLDAPPGTQVAWQMPEGAKTWSPQDPSNRGKLELRTNPFLGFRAGDQDGVIHAQSALNAAWEQGQAASAGWQLVSAPADDKRTIGLRIDTWLLPHRDERASMMQLQLMVGQAPVLTDSFPLTIASQVAVQSATEADEIKVEVPQRPGVNAKENTDEFPLTQGRFVRFTVVATNDQSAPGLDELEIYGTDPKVNLALKGKASASSVIGGYPIHQIPHLNDGKLGNPKSWISAENNGGWAQIEFPEAVAMGKIVWARDRTGVCMDRLPVKYRIEISGDGKNWTKVGDESGRAPATTALAGAVKKDAAPGYEMESIPLPFPGCRPSDVLFTSDGTMYLIAMTEGQIWRAKTPSLERPGRVHWQRYAAGLYHPIGLAMVGDRLFVAQKPEITELIDHDGDGTVDHYKTLATGWGLSTGWHEYCFGLAVDQDQNLWFALNTGYFWTNPGYVNPGRWRGSVMKASTSTERLEEVAKGCRVPNGVSVGPDGQIFFTDNQGDWIQVCKLAHVVPGRFYGHPEYKEDALPKDQYPTGRSAIWFPYHRMRSISGPVLDNTNGAFGPFANQQFVGDVGYGANAGIMRVALEKVDGEYQGACFPFIDNQPLGVERMRFGPDQCLYIASLTSGLTRLKYVGKESPFAMQSVRIRPAGQGVVIRLTKPLNDKQELKPGQFQVKQYHYLYTGNYGSPQSGEKRVPVEAVTLSDDRMTITLTMPVETYPIGMVYELNVGELRDAKGEKMLHNEAWYTVHKIPQ